MNNGKKLYENLAAYLEKVRSIEAAIQLCEWDQETYMPHDGIFFRSLTVSNLAEIHHKLCTSSQYKKLLGSLIDLNSAELIHTDLSDKEMLNLKVLKEDYDKKVKLPVKFVKEVAKLSSEAVYAWQTAKAHSDFKSFAPFLKKIVKANQKKAQLLGFKAHPYDALLDLFEPGLTVAFLDDMFIKLKQALVHLLRQITAVKKTPKPIHTEAGFHHQMQLSRDILEKIGLKKEFSRLDTTEHPFCTTIGPKDIRMTTHVHEDDFTKSLYSVLHEGGHGLYGLGVSKYAIGLPEGQSASLGLDESQSRLYETRFGASFEFIEAIYPLIKEHLKNPNLSLDALYEHINKVEPHLIRIESDEVTYCLHIILRYEIEKGLIEGSISVDNIPKVWNEKMESYLGICPKNDATGCLQDIHWSMGSLGYFPTYALGNIYAASLYEAFLKLHPDFTSKIKNFDLSEMQNFLQKNLYDHGRLLKPLELMKKITPHGLDINPYINYLTQKYSKIYKLD